MIISSYLALAPLGPMTRGYIEKTSSMDTTEQCPCQSFRPGDRSLISTVMDENISSTKKSRVARGGAETPQRRPPPSTKPCLLVPGKPKSLSRSQLMTG